jgi:transposase-like protein
LEDDPLLSALREGAQRMLISAVEAEVEAFLALHSGETDEAGRRRVVRNGHGPERSIQTGIGPIKVRRPKVRDRGASIYKPIRFTSSVLPAYLRRTKNIEELLPWLYLKGVSTGQFDEALTALLGPGAPGLSAATVRRLTTDWDAEHKRWQDRDLSARRFVYVWADGVYFRPRLDHERQCILVLIGADETGRKELLAIDDGFRESAQSWKEMLVRLRQKNGLEIAPELAIGDGALGFWKALHEIWPTTAKQRCWVHKTANVLNTMPKSVQGKAKSDLHEIYRSAGRKEAEQAMVFKLAKSAEKTWRQLNGSQQLGQLIKGIKFRDGEPIQKAEACAAA